jgi:hypothetical protein
MKNAYKRMENYIQVIDDLFPGMTHKNPGMTHSQKPGNCI